MGRREREILIRLRTRIGGTCSDKYDSVSSECSGEDSGEVTREVNDEVQ
jgi:hypothetical protein